MCLKEIPGRYVMPPANSGPTRVTTVRCPDELADLMTKASISGADLGYKTEADIQRTGSYYLSLWILARDPKNDAYLKKLGMLGDLRRRESDITAIDQVFINRPIQRLTALVSEGSWDDAEGTLIEVLKRLADWPDKNEANAITKRLKRRPVVAQVINYIKSKEPINDNNGASNNPGGLQAAFPGMETLSVGGVEGP